MSEVEFLLNPHSGELVARGADPALLATLAASLGVPEDLDCGQCPPPQSGQFLSADVGAQRLVRVAGFLHQSMVDGPGLRSVVFMQGCPHRCAGGCRSPRTHDPQGGTPMPVDAILAELLRPGQPRDGVTISGGDPFAQPEACAELVTRLKAARIQVIVYTGFTYDQLARSMDPAIRRVLALADVLVDGTYVAALRQEGLAYRGSSNQRVIDLAATRSTGELRLLDVD